MMINADFFKTTFKTAHRQLFEAFDKAKKWIRENRFLDGSARFFGAAYERLVVQGKYTKRDLVVLFIAAVILGIAFKAVATDTVTIGFEDYTLAPEGTLYDLNAMQKDLIGRGGVPISGDAAGGACSE
ncbi:MAG: hypothetical protein AAB547_00385 [Patescibacteria group bacterium]